MTDNKIEVKDHFELYKQYSGNLRNWFVVYGVGGAVLFINNAELFNSCSTCQKVRVASAFLTGVFVQILVAFLNKYINLHLANFPLGEGGESSANDKKKSLAERLSYCFWIDKLADFLSIALFIWAAVELIVAIACSN